MRRIRINDLLKKVPLDELDAVRLILETMEEMPELKNDASMGRVPLMQALRRVLREGVASVRTQDKTVCFRQAAEESLERRVSAGRRATTLRDLRYYIRKLLRVPGLAERPLRAICCEECQRVLESAFAGSVHSFRKGRAILHSIFAYGVRQGWCSSNPVAFIEVPKVEEREIVPLTLAECRSLVDVAKTPQFCDCLPALGLMLFAGVRPGEVTRLRWKDVNSDEGILSIAARHSKTGGGRRVELCTPLRRMLKRLRPMFAGEGTAHLCPPHWNKRWQRLRRHAGLLSPQRRWVPDVLRHSFASYHAITYKNMPELQLQLGHRDSRLLLTRYLNLSSIRRAEAAPFWRLLG